MSACYRIEHETRYVYASTVTTSQHVAYLRPRELPTQHVLSSELAITPQPIRVIERTDYFGNDVLVEIAAAGHPTPVLARCGSALAVPAVGNPIWFGWAAEDARVLVE